MASRLLGGRRGGTSCSVVACRSRRADSQSMPLVWSGQVRSGGSVGSLQPGHTLCPRSSWELWLNSVGERSLAYLSIWGMGKQERIFSPLSRFPRGPSPLRGSCCGEPLLSRLSVQMFGGPCRSGVPQGPHTCYYPGRQRYHHGTSKSTSYHLFCLSMFREIRDSKAPGSNGAKLSSILPRQAAA